MPRGRPTLVCGSAGSGKTLLGLEFLVRGVTEFNENGVLMTFEENAEELQQNVRSLGFDLDALVKDERLSVDCVRVERSEIDETGEYDLEGLFIRLGQAIASVQAKRVVLDTLETLFAGFSNAAILRAELRRLFRWLKDQNVTALITGERGERTLTRHGLEEYVSDCVILLDHRVIEQVSTRRLRVVKYRGSAHGTNEYPFLIDDSGLSVLPITSLSLDHEVSQERLSTGIFELDRMLGGQGVYLGSSVLISGTAGTGKTTLAAQLAIAAAKGGGRSLYFSFEEAPQQIIRDLRSVGMDLQPLVTSGALRIRPSRPALTGLERHLVTMHKEVNQFEPSLVAIDPISSFSSSAPAKEVAQMITRMVDFLKERQITVVMTNLTSPVNELETTGLGISSVIDTWILLRDIESNGQRNRGLSVMKSRGTAHSNQLREFVISRKGLELREPIWVRERS